MNKKILFHLIVVILIGLIGSPLSAEVHSWEIDKEHTNFYFSVDHIYAKVQGRFTDYKGTFLLILTILKGVKYPLRSRSKVLTPA